MKRILGNLLAITGLSLVVLARAVADEIITRGEKLKGKEASKGNR